MRNAVKSRSIDLIDNSLDGSSVALASAREVRTSVGSARNG
jgi:hypothetical protein